MGTPHTPESRAKISAARKGKPLSAEHRAAISAASRGKPKTIEHRAKIGAAQKGRADGPHTPEHKAKIQASSIAYGPRPRTAEHTEKIAAAKRGKKLPPKTAEHKAKIKAAKTGKKRPPFSDEWKRKIGLNRPAKGPSSLERTIAAVFDSLGIVYEQQAPAGWYHLDFLLPNNIVVECDGLYWHSRPRQVYMDQRRDAWLTRHGYTVFRLKEADILRDPVGLIESLCHHFK